MVWAAAVVMGASILGSAQDELRPQPSTARGEWPTYGGDLASSKYSPLDQINRGEFRVADSSRGARSRPTPC